MALPTPYLDKLNALLDNDKLPINDKERIDHAIEKYREWIQSMIDAEGEQSVVINRLVSLGSEYKQFIDLDTIFDSESDFLYRQKGQCQPILMKCSFFGKLKELVHRSGVTRRRIKADNEAVKNMRDTSVKIHFHRRYLSALCPT